MSNRPSPGILALGVILALGGQQALAQGTRLLKEPDLSKDHIAFVYAGDIWVADLDGGHPRQLTTGPDADSRPQFSPDGRQLAFTSVHGGNADVYLVDVNGGQPKRLTWHPGHDLVEGWSPDGKSVLFTSDRDIGHNRAAQAFEVAARGGMPARVMAARAEDPAWSPDGKQLAYRPIIMANRGASGWRQHRGGDTPPIWILDPKSGAMEEVPHEHASDFQPMWVGADLYFLSDRGGSVGLYGYDKQKGVWPVTDTRPWDIQSANAHGHDIIFSAGGQLHLWDLDQNKGRVLDIDVHPELPERRIQWKNVQDNIEAAQLSPTGKRVVVTARGEIFTVPVEHGSVRNLSQSDGVREMTGIWSAKGDQLAYLSDERGHYQLVLSDQNGKAGRHFDLSKEPSNYFSLVTFADEDRKIVFRDSHLHLKVIDLKSGDIQTIATSPIRTTFLNGSDRDAVSPDGAWLAYSLVGPSFNRRLFLYNFKSGKATAVTQGMSDASNPAFSPDGKYLYFMASTNSGTSAAGIDMSTQERPYRAGLYALVLQKDGSSPLLPKSDEEKAAKEVDAKDKQKDDKEAKPKPVKIDLEDLSQRIVPLPVDERAYSQLAVASDGALFYLDNPQPGASSGPGMDDDAQGRIMRFDMEKREAKEVTDKVAGFGLSRDGKLMLLMGPHHSLMTAKAEEKLDPKALDLKDLKLKVDPAKEWPQIFTDAWRMEKDFFYAANMHGLDWQGIYDRYRPLVDDVGTRSDLTALIVSMIGELQVGHNRAYGGDSPRGEAASVGLLGADVALENGAFRLTKIYDGGQWNPYLAAPLAAPGIKVKEGDYVLAVNGRPYGAGDNFYAPFENQVGQQVRLSIASSPSGKDAHEVTVVPTAREGELRLWDWIDANRRYVDKMSKGRVGYVYLPNTAEAGFTFFNRLFFAQLDKEGIILDERSNGGGQIANYITDVLSRRYLAGFRDRDGKVWGSPAGALDGPKVMLIDQDAGSGGDFLPYAFRHLGIGKLIGTRTWGGLIAIYHNPPLVDGGTLTVPFIRIFDANGHWLAENVGIVPDIEVKLLPKAVNEGKDAQLDRAIDEVLTELKGFKPVRFKTSPPIPDTLGK
ncbi:PDZ domain-containing protein [Gallaecimonas kandeliae]|uniref:S41 family peptidase n=1 Tax=Gallaecimonas kandeliae TaxID=3029055 RepID=UPI00264988E4|nr:S41 family peptidase [Gallaecimonas kandeliae]WKE66897.1 PDZ domain-containing protein [Gallaecimonas kandeliae]